MMPVDIEDRDQLVDYLCATGLASPTQPVQVTRLTGGVSNKTMSVHLHDDTAWVVKQALPKLRVQADWYSDPARIHREALGLRWYALLAPQSMVPGLVFEDEINHVVVMQAVPQPHDNWKTLLLRGDLDPQHIRQFGSLLSQCQRHAIEQHNQLQPMFADRAFFEALRLEPYYRYTASRIPASACFYDALITDTLSHALTLVHGDYSPKNVLVHHDQLVLLDYEVAHWGDPAFDVGFALTHLLSKAHHIAARRDDFAHAALLFWLTYRGGVGDAFGEIEARAVRHTLACLLARVDGRSPLEYLTDAERERQRYVVLGLMDAVPVQMDALITQFIQQLDKTH